jgi:hypothetical protein
MMMLIEQIGDGYDDDDDDAIIICTLIECYQSIYLSIHVSIYFFLTD